MDLGNLNMRGRRSALLGCGYCVVRNRRDDAAQREAGQEMRDARCDDQLRTGREIMDEYREVLHALAGKRLFLADRLAMCDPAAEPNEDAVYWANRPPVGRELL